MVDSGYRGFLIAVNDGDKGSRFPIAIDSCYIGASVECEVRLLDVDCKDRHCLIKFLRNNRATVYCLCNERPVLLNDAPIDKNGSPLKNGDIIQIVDVKFKWEENDSFVDTNLDGDSTNVENNSSEEFELRRFSEPAQIIDRENLLEDKQKDEPHLVYNNINVDEKKNETKVTSETTPLVKSSISSPNVKTTISSHGNNRSNYNHGSHNQSENNSSRDTSQTRRSRQFCPTYKTKSTTKTPDEKKTASSVKSFFKNTPLQENNRTPGREVKSRLFMNRNSFTKVTKPSFFAETSEKISALPKGNCGPNHEVSVDNSIKEEEKMVPKDDAAIESKENTHGNETNAEEATFETTVPSDVVEAPSGLGSLAIPKCFIKAIHSTPKALDLNKSELPSNLEANETINISDSIYGPDEPTRICSLDNNSILVSPVKSGPENDVFCRKKMESDNSRVEVDSLSETRRHHTRSTSNILKKTFEERSEDNPSVGEKSLTTPEKSTNECNSRSGNPSLIVDESELDSYSREKKVDSRNCVSGSIRSPLPESTSELSAENGEVVSMLEARDKSQKHDDSSMMAKCSRNLSSFSPPENNKSQEYMDSVVSTPKKPCLMEDDESLSVTAVTPPATDSVVDGVACISTPMSPSSCGRRRRSTDIVPCVGTPSDVYRTTKGGFTPAHHSRFNRTSMEVEVSIGPRDSLGSVPSKLASKRSSSERKSTPLKSDKSLARDSLQMHSPIVEEYDLENEESQHESPINDSQYQFVSKRRRRLAKSSFAVEDRILEESELISSDLSDEQSEAIDEESLEPMESLDDNSELASVRLVINRTTDNETQNALGSPNNLDSMEEAVDGTKLESTTLAIKPVLPKSILTPGPRHVTSAVREKSAKKVTFCNLEEDSRCTDASVGSMADLDSDYDLHLSSRVNSSAEVSSIGGENTSLSKNDSDNDQLYLSDKSSDAYSFNESAQNSDSIVQNILAKRNKSVKRLSSASKAKSPRLSGIRKLMNPPVSPKCDYTNVSGVKQLMKTPESLIKSVPKPSLKSPKAQSMETPVPSKEIENTPESRAKRSNAIANRQKTPASFGKRAKTPDALAECLSMPKALMVLAKPPEIVVEFVKTPKKADVSISLPENEVGESTPGARRKSHAGNGDSTSATPTMRRCSHHRIHRSSLCMLASSVNTTLNETLSSHNCSASLENSVVELNAENEIMPPPQNPQEAFQVVLAELKEKLLMLQKREDDADKEVLENSINVIDEVLVDESVPDSETVAEENLRNVLLDLKKRYSYSEKSNVNESSIRTEIRQSVVSEIDINELSIPSQSNRNDETVVTAAGEASKDSIIDESISTASQSGAVVAETTKFEKVANNNSLAKKSEEIQSRISTALHSDQDVFCVGSLVETVNNDVDVMNSENTETSNDVTSSIEAETLKSLCTDSENILSATDDLSKTEDAYHSIVEFEHEKSALVEKETTAEIMNEEPQVDAPMSVPAEIQNSSYSGESSISHIAEGKGQPKPDISVSEVDLRNLPKHMNIEEQETDSENLELFVTDSDDLASLEPKLIVEENSNSEESGSDVTKATNDSVENTTDCLTKSILPENCVGEIVSNKPTIPANDSLIAEKVQRKSCQDNSAVSNDTFKTCPISNLTTVEVEEIGKTPKILDTIVAHDKSKRFLDVSAHLLMDKENKENLLSLTPIATRGKEKSILQDMEKTPAPSGAIECDVTDSLLLTLVVDTPNITKRLDSSVFAGSDIEENIGAPEKSVITPAKLSNAEVDVSISLNSSYPASTELDTTREENLSCIEPSMTETETVLNTETSAEMIEESRTPITSCATDDGRTTDVSSETPNTSQASTSSFDIPLSSEVCSTSVPSEVSSSVSDNAKVAPVVAELPDSNAQSVVTPPKCAAVTISIAGQDQLTLAGPNIVTQTIKNSARSISTSTPILSDVTQKTMEIPRSCSTTIDPSPSEDEAAELSSESSETVVDDEHATVDSSACSDESQSKDETVSKKIHTELVFDASTKLQPAETFYDDAVAQESQNDPASTTVSQETVSAAASEESGPEKETDEDSEVATDTEKTDMLVKRLSRNLIVLIQDAKDDLSSSETTSTSSESARKKVIADKLVADNEGESTRPKRGRPPKRYTEPKGETSTQSSKRIKNTANAATSNLTNLSIELERVEMAQGEEPATASQSKRVHSNTKPEVKRSTKKLNDPTSKRLRTESKTEDSDVPPPADNAINQFGSPLSIVIRKIGSHGTKSSAATKDLPKRASRSRSVAPKKSTRTRPPRAASCLGVSSDEEIIQPKRRTVAKKVELVSSTKVSANKGSRRKDDAAETVAPKPKETAKVSKNAAKNKKKTEVADPPKEEKQSKRKAADEVVQNVDVAGSSTSGSKGKNKNDSSKAAEAPAEGERKTKRKAAEVVEKTTKSKTTKSKKNASQNEDEPVGKAKSQNEVPAKDEKRSRRKVAEDVQENENGRAKAGKRAAKGAEKDEVSETEGDSNSVSRAGRPRKAAQPVVEAAEPPKRAKRAKVDLSTETATTSRATRGRKVAVKTNESNEKKTKLTKNEATVASETSRSKAVKRTAVVMLDSIAEVVSKKRKQSPDPVPVAAKSTRRKKNEVPIVMSEVKVNLRRQKVDEKSNIPSTSTKTVADKKPVTSAVSKKKTDPTQNVRPTRTAKVKDVSEVEGSVAVAATTSRVTRSRHVPTLPVSRRAKK